ncbi:MAG TPA: helix-turn-helix transcriptional regulator [Desulfosporosinus sp.]|nr:helix-turn-helix transcriptional regulator [Desulfosporosinus sp.]
MKTLRVNKDRLCELRIKQGNTFKSLSEKSGVHYLVISRLESGTNTTRPANAVKIANALGVPFEELFEIIDSKVVE